MAYRKCPTCGTSVDASASECPNCGAAVADAPTTRFQSTPIVNAGSGAGSSTHDHEEAARRLSQAMSMAHVVNANSGVGKLIGFAILLFVLGIMGFIGYSVFKTVTAVNESIDEALEGVPDIDELIASPPGAGEANGKGTAPDPRSQPCAQELAAYTDALLATDGQNDGGLEAKFGKKSLETRTVRRAYAHVVEAVEAGEDAAIAVDEAAAIIVKACEKKVKKP